MLLESNSVHTESLIRNSPHIPQALLTERWEPEPNTHRDTHTHTHAHTHTHTHTHTETHTRTFTHAHSHTHTHTHRGTHTHTLTHTLPHTLSHTHSHTHIDTHTHTHSHTRTHSRTHTHSHTHTHTLTHTLMGGPVYLHRWAMSSLHTSPIHTARWSRKIARKLPECLLCERKHVLWLIPGLIPGWDLVTLPGSVPEWALCEQKPDQCRKGCVVVMTHFIVGLFYRVFWRQINVHMTKSM